MQKEGSFPGTGAGTPLGEALPPQTGGKRLQPSIPRQSWGNELHPGSQSLAGNATLGALPRLL